MLLQLALELAELFGSCLSVAVVMEEGGVVEVDQRVLTAGKGNMANGTTFYNGMGQSLEGSKFRGAIFFGRNKYITKSLRHHLSIQLPFCLLSSPP